MRCIVLYRTHVHTCFLVALRSSSLRAAQSPAGEGEVEKGRIGERDEGGKRGREIEGRLGRMKGGRENKDVGRKKEVLTVRT
jgi:hypothetical protein